MHCNCVVYFSVIAWNTLGDLQNYGNYCRLYVISSLITGTAQSHKPFFTRKLQNSNQVLIRFLLRKPESGFCRTQPETGSKKSKMQSMHTSVSYTYRLHCITFLDFCVQQSHATIEIIRSTSFIQFWQRSGLNESALAEVYCRWVWLDFDLKGLWDWLDKNDSGTSLPAAQNTFDTLLKFSIVVACRNRWSWSRTFPLVHSWGKWKIRRCIFPAGFKVGLWNWLWVKKRSKMKVWKNCFYQTVRSQ